MASIVKETIGASVCKQPHLGHNWDTGARLLLLREVLTRLGQAGQISDRHLGPFRGERKHARNGTKPVLGMESDFYSFCGSVIPKLTVP